MNDSPRQNPAYGQLPFFTDKYARSMADQLILGQALGRVCIQSAEVVGLQPGRFVRSGRAVVPHLIIREML